MSQRQRWRLQITRWTHLTKVRFQIKYKSQLFLKDKSNIIYLYHDHTYFTLEVNVWKMSIISFELKLKTSFQQPHFYSPIFNIAWRSSFEIPPGRAEIQPDSHIQTLSTWLACEGEGSRICNIITGDIANGPVCLWGRPRSVAVSYKFWSKWNLD